MIARLGSALSRWSSRWVPDPFVLALALTLLVFAVGAARLYAADGGSDGGVLWTLSLGWATGFSSGGGLAFALQMCLVLVTGHAMALSPPVQRAIRAVATVPRSAAVASALVALVACGAALLHWGLGAIAGALLAREIGRNAPGRGLAIHYPLLGAAAYSGMAVWHGGLSGSAPLKVAEGASAELIGTLPLADTIWSAGNLLVTGSLVVLIPLLFYALTPKSESDLVAPDPDQLAPLPERTTQARPGPIGWLEGSPVVGQVIGILGLFFALAAIASERLRFDINSVNILFLSVSMALQGSLRHFVAAVADGARGAGAIIIQFPLYFGILGVMKASGMIAWVSDAMVTVSSADSFPVLSYLSAGLVNLFVPSGGGQWAVQSDILLTAGGELGVAPARTVMSFAYGDAWTNMLQPFWALPLLGIMGLRARDIIGYTAMVFLMMAVAVPALLLVLT